MNNKLSIAIPIYNFADFLPETLDSILIQHEISDVEILILDGASTDSTPQLIKNYQRYFSNIKYIRLSERGGIDRDMALAVSKSSGEYCWLFSGDDVMLQGSVSKVLELIESGCDLYLARHYEWVDDIKEWVAWPTLKAEDGQVYELSELAQRYNYFSQAQNTEAFFGFIGGLIVKRSKWESVSINEAFVGTCWAHVARFFEIMNNGLTVKILGEPFLYRRPDNDSFGSGSIINRFRLTIDGFLNISDHFFGRESFESAEVRRVLRNEYHPLNMWLGKFLCLIDPKREKIDLMDRLFTELYGDNTFANWRVRIAYWRVSPKRFRQWQPALAAKYDALKNPPPTS